MSARFTSTYNTQDELDYLRNIGSFRVVGKKRYTKSQLLTFYKNSAKYRTNWGDIDKTVILDFLEKEIEKNK